MNDDEIVDAEIVSETLPARVGGLEERQRLAGGSLRGLREALAVAEEQAGEVADTGDYEALGYGWNELKLVAKDLKSLIDSVERLILREAPHVVKEVKGEERTFYDDFFVDGVGTFEILRKGVTRRWESEELLRHIVTMGMIDAETGELPSDEARETVEKVVALLVQVVPFTSSLGWRVTALQELGIQIDEWCTESRGPGFSIKFTGKKE
jgi:hypothetical protein